MNQLTFRPGRQADIPRLNEILNDPPPPAMLAIAGSPAMSLRTGLLLLEAGIALSLETTTVAETNGRVVGLMDAGANHQEPKVTPSLVLKLLPRLIFAGAAGATYRLLRSRPAWARVGPAQHLYERAGFRVVETKRHEAYAPYSGGSPGRLRMVKELS